MRTDTHPGDARAPAFRVEVEPEFMERPGTHFHGLVPRRADAEDVAAKRAGTSPGWDSGVLWGSEWQGLGLTHWCWSLVHGHPHSQRRGPSCWNHEPTPREAGAPVPTILRFLRPVEVVSALTSSP